MKRNRFENAMAKNAKTKKKSILLFSIDLRVLNISILLLPLSIQNMS